MPGAPLGGFVGKGSLTKARLLGPSCIRPLPRDHCETKRFWVSVVDMVAEGYGMEVLVARAYWEARASGPV